MFNIKLNVAARHILFIFKIKLMTHSQNEKLIISNYVEVNVDDEVEWKE